MWESGRTGEWERHGLDDDDDDDGGDDDGGVVGETCIVVLSTNDATIASSCKSVAVNIGGGVSGREVSMVVTRSIFVRPSFWDQAGPQSKQVGKE